MVFPPLPPPSPDKPSQASSPKGRCREHPQYRQPPLAPVLRRPQDGPPGREAEKPGADWGKHGDPALRDVGLMRIDSVPPGAPRRLPHPGTRHANAWRPHPLAPRLAARKSRGSRSISPSRSRATSGLRRAAATARPDRRSSSPTESVKGGGNPQLSPAPHLHFASLSCLTYPSYPLLPSSSAPDIHAL